MINVPSGTRILLATRPVDFRKVAHGFAAVAQETLAQNPFSGAVIVWRCKRGDRVKISVTTGNWCNLHNARFGAALRLLKLSGPFGRRAYRR